MERISILQPEIKIFTIEAITFLLAPYIYIPRGIDDLTFPPSTDFVLDDGSYNMFEQKLVPLVSEYKSKELLRYVFLFGLCGTRFGKMERPEEMSASFTFDPFRFCFVVR